MLKIDIYVFDDKSKTYVYACTTSQAKTIKEAKAKFIKKFGLTNIKAVKVK